MNWSIILAAVCNESLNTAKCSSDLLQSEVTKKTFMVDFLVVLPIIVLLGLVGNIISLVTILKTSKLRHIPANQYLIVLTVSDSVFLLALVFTLLELDFRLAYICMAFEYVMMAARYTSSWTITALTIERFLAIFYPLSRLNYGDMHRTRCIIGRMLPLPWIINLVMFGYLEPQNDLDQHACVAKSGVWQVLIELADLVLCYVIPCFIVVGMNLLVAIRLKKAARERISFTDVQKSYQLVPISVSSGGVDTANEVSQVEHMTLRSNIPHSQRSGFAGILIVVPVAFLLLNTPWYVVRVLTTKYSVVNDTLSIVVDTDVFSSDLLLLCYNSAYYLFYLNFASNFIVYAFSSRHFRQAALSSWRRIITPQ